MAEPIGRAEPVEPMDVTVARAGGCRYPMHIGGSHLAPPASFLDAVARELRRPAAHQYAPVGGTRELRAQLAAWHGRTAGRRFDERQVAVGCGAGDCLAALLETILHPGDGAVVLSPHWHLITGQLRARGARIDELPFFTGGTAPGAAETRALLEPHLGPDVRLIYLATPNNPDGALVSAESLAVLIELAHQRDLWLLCDEVYDRLVYAPRQMVSAWQIEGAGRKLVTAHSFSKAIGAAGARVGYLLADPEVVPGVELALRHRSFCASPLFQAGCAAALDDAAFAAEQLAAFDQARRRSAEALGVRPPDAGIFHFLPVRDEAATLAPALLRDTGVATVPGGGAGAAYQRFLRICFTSLPIEDAEAGARKIAAWLDARGQRI